MTVRRPAERYARTTRLVVSGDQSYVGSVIVALDANHIPHADVPGGLPWAPATTVMVREIDIRRAREAILDLQSTPVGVSNDPSGRLFGRVLLAFFLVAVAFGVIVVVAEWFRH